VISNKEDKNIIAKTDSIVSKGAIATIEQKSTSQQIKSLDINTESKAYKTESSIYGTTSSSSGMYATNDVSASHYMSANANAVIGTQSIASNKASGPSLSNNTYNFYAPNSSTINNTNKDETTTRLADKDFAFAEKSKEKYDDVPKQLNATALTASNTIIALPTIRVKRDSTVEAIPVTGYFSKKVQPSKQNIELARKIA